MRPAAGIAASAPRNLAEGFGRFRPAAFGQFVETAIGSINETRCTLNDGIDRGHFTPQSVARAQELAIRALQVSTKLLVYLKKRAKTERRT